MEQIKNSVLNVSKKLIIGLVVLSIAGFAQVLKPADAYAGVLFESPVSNSSTYHPDPKVRAELRPSELEYDGRYFGEIDSNTDPTKYSDHGDWIKNVRIEIYDPEIALSNDKMRVFFKTESGATFFTDIDVWITLKIEDKDGKYLETLKSHENFHLDDDDNSVIFNSGKCIDGDKSAFNKLWNDPEHFEGKIYVSEIEVKD